MATVATFSKFPAPPSPEWDSRFSGGLTCGALVTAGVDASPVAVDYTAFKRYNGSTIETVDISGCVPRLLVVSNLGAATVNVYPGGLTAASGGCIPVAAGATLQVTVRTAAFPLTLGSAAGGESVSVLALMDGTVATA